MIFWSLDMKKTLTKMNGCGRNWNSVPYVTSLHCLGLRMYFFVSISNLEYQSECVCPLWCFSLLFFSSLEIRVEKLNFKRSWTSSEHICVFDREKECVDGGGIHPRWGHVHANVGTFKKRIFLFSPLWVSIHSRLELFTSIVLVLTCYSRAWTPCRL